LASRRAPFATVASFWLGFSPDDLESIGEVQVPWQAVPKEAELMDAPKTAEYAHIGRSVTVKGELSGSEDLFIDGQVEGTIELRGNNLTIGPHGEVKANVNAKDVVVQGKLEGNIQASERAELKKSAVAVGDILTQRVAIEEGAYFKGKIEVQKDARPGVQAAGKS
jgi:cytoskeletal protein CcmA (bactofilin family)